MRAAVNALAGYLGGGNKLAEEEKGICFLCKTSLDDFKYLLLFADLLPKVLFSQF